MSSTASVRRLRGTGRERQRDGHLGGQADEAGATEHQDGIADQPAGEGVSQDTLAGEGDRSSHGLNVAKRPPAAYSCLTSTASQSAPPAAQRRRRHRAARRRRTQTSAASREEASRLAVARATATACAASWSPCSRHHCWPASGRVWIGS